MRGGRHEQEMSRDRTECLPKLVALGVFHFSAEETCRHAVRFIADDEVPRWRGLKPFPQVLGPGQHVKTRNHALVLSEEITRCSRFDLISRQNVEEETKFFRKLVLPLLNKATRSHDQAPFKIPPDQEFL